MNLFIESIEGGLYIAGIGEEKATRFIRDEYRNSSSFQSITDWRRIYIQNGSAQNLENGLGPCS